VRVDMPLTKEKAALYPGNWKRIRAEVLARAENRCECFGECGLHRTTPGPRRCVEIHLAPAKWAKGQVVLTIAHLNHNPKDSRRRNLKAMCQRCHLRYDVKHHQKNASETRDRKRGVLRLFPDEKR